MTETSSQTIDLSELAGEWSLDGDRSSVGFRSTSLWGLIKVKGKFTSVRGDAHVESDGAASGQLVIDASSVDTGNKKRDTHLRSDDFFSVSKYPEIVFELHNVEARPDHYVLSGTLTIIGKSEPLELTAHVDDRDASGLTVHAETTVDRSRWGITFRKSGMTNMDTGLDISAHFTRR